MKSNIRLLAFLMGATLLFCISVPRAAAQDVRATIGGRVTDTQGAVIPGAAVAVTSVETGVALQTRTNAEGVWIVQFLLPGHYNFTIISQGFKTEDRRGIELQAADNKEIDVQLSLGAISQTVTVTSEAPLIDTSTASSGTVINSAEINELPTSSHVVTLFATLSPGVVAQYQNKNVAYLWSFNAASQFESNGGRNNIYSNNFQLDGMADTKSGGDVAFIPPQDSVQEFRVQTNAYDASIGRQAGSTINMQTKAGGSSYHGDLYEYNQNNMLNANYYQNDLTGAPKPPVHFNEFGGTFGGPVWVPKIYHGRQKTFFFVSYDDTHNLDPVTDIRSIPTALERQGDFSQSFTIINGQKFPVQLFNPYSVDSKGNRQPFECDLQGNPIVPSGNVQVGGAACAKIPSQMLSPIAVNILKFVPLPNTTSLSSGNAVQNYVSPATRRDAFPVLSVRVDQAWNNTQHSFFTLRWAHLHENAYSDFNDAATGNLMERIIWQAAFDHVSTLSNTKTLDMRFIVNRYGNPNHDTGAGFDPTQLGFPATYAKELVKPSFPFINGFGGTPSSNNFGTNQASGYTNNTYYTGAATLTDLHGNHTFHYGGEYWILQEADGSIGRQGEWDFSNV